MRCLVCGQIIEENGTECPFCGAVIEDSEEDSMYQSFSELDSFPYTVVLTRIRTGEEMEISVLPAVVGRSSNCDITIKGNPAIGRAHLEISRLGDNVFVKDLGSRNHTYVDGERIRDVCVIKGPTRLVLADEEFLIEIKGS